MKLLPCCASVINSSIAQTKRLGMVLAAAHAAALLAPSGVAAATTWDAVQAGNPVIPGYFADPCSRKFGDTYYLYVTPDGWDAAPPASGLPRTM
jgi:hypothetical protein